MSQQRAQVPELRQEHAKWAPRRSNGEGVDASPIAKTSTPRGSMTPRGVTSTPRSRFSNNSPSQSMMSPGGGSTLFVAGMGSAQRRRASEGSHMFRSTTTIGDAHIKDVSQRITQGGYSAARSTMAQHGSASFRSKSPSDRDSHMRSLMSSTYGSPRTGTGYSPARTNQLPSASFRSASPTACAHITALPKPTDVSYTGGATPRGGRSPSHMFRSTTSIGDAHIKAAPKMHDASYNTPRGTSRDCTSPFRSTTSIADAHIKAVPKPVDVVVAYRD